MINSIFNKIKKTTKHNIFNYYFKTYNSTLFNNSLILKKKKNNNRLFNSKVIVNNNNQIYSKGIKLIFYYSDFSFLNIKSELLKYILPNYGYLVNVLYIYTNHMETEVKSGNYMLYANITEDILKKITYCNSIEDELLKSEIKSEIDKDIKKLLDTEIEKLYNEIYNEIIFYYNFYNFHEFDNLDLVEIRLKLTHIDIPVKELVIKSDNPNLNDLNETKLHIKVFKKVIDIPINNNIYINNSFILKYKLDNDKLILLDLLNDNILISFKKEDCHIKCISIYNSLITELNNNNECFICKINKNKYIFRFKKDNSTIISFLIDNNNNNNNNNYNINKFSLFLIFDKFKGDIIKRYLGDFVGIFKYINNKYILIYSYKKLTFTNLLEFKKIQLTNKKLNNINNKNIYLRVGSNYKIGALDIETINYLDTNIVIIASVAIFDCDNETNKNRNIYNIYQSNIKTLLYDITTIKSPSNDMKIKSIYVIINCLINLLKSYNDYTFYIHNFRSYDSIYIIYALDFYNNYIGYTHISYRITYVKGKCYKLKLYLLDKNKNRISSINLTDSNVILHGSLKSLCNKFNIPNEYSKLNFPLKFITNIDLLDYKGNFPSINYFNNICDTEYLNIKSKYTIDGKYDLLNHLLDYSANDVISLLLLMEYFRLLLTKLFDIDLVRNLTITRIAMNIFYDNYAEKNTCIIPKIDITNYKKLRKYLYGGITCVYKPYGNNVYYYDINSFYPSMALKDLPGLECKHVIFNTPKIYKPDSNKIVYYYCEVEMPTDLYMGVLPIKDDKGLLIYPTGSFKGYWTTPELDLAFKVGAKISVQSGFEFNKIKSPFENYIKEIYSLKCSAKYGERELHKSLLNNLIGRFGISIISDVTMIVNYEEFKLISLLHKVHDSQTLVDGRILLNFCKDINTNWVIDKNIDINSILNNPIYSNLNISKSFLSYESSIVITSLINAYARAYLNELKLDLINKGYTIYYCDTDSLILDKPLPDDLVSNTDLGKFKLEYIAAEAFFISNKLYALFNENKEIIKIASAGIPNSSLTYNDFQNLYNGLIFETTIPKSINFKTYVQFKDITIKFNPNSFTKRIKIYDHNHKWIQTKPIIIKK